MILYDTLKNVNVSKVILIMKISSKMLHDWYVYLVLNTSYEEKSEKNSLKR